MTAISSRFIWCRPVAVRISACAATYFGLGLGDLLADYGSVAACLETCPVLGDLGVILGDARPGGFGPGLGGRVFESRGLLGDPHLDRWTSHVVQAPEDIWPCT